MLRRLSRLSLQRLQAPGPTSTVCLQDLTACLKIDQVEPLRPLADAAVVPAWARQHGLKAAFRGFATSGTSPPGTHTPQDAQSVLQRLDAAHFKEVLEQESETRWNVDHGELVQLCINSGAAKTEEDAAEIIEALDRSGVVLRVKNLVYLRPLEVAEIIYQALPDTDREVRERLDQLRAEIRPLLERKVAIDSHAHRVSKRVLWGGLLVMLGQWALFFRLTFWELSWDVMEPLTYFVGAAFGIAAYAYCLWYNEEFGYVRARERIHSSVADRVYEREGFDKGRFDYLLRRIHRLESSLMATGGVTAKAAR